MQSLKLASYLMDPARTGHKKVTIRKGNRKIVVGENLSLINADDPHDQLDVFVRGAIVAPLDTLGDEEARADGFSDWDDLFHGLKQFYPDLVHDDLVTVVFWE